MRIGANTAPTVAFELALPVLGAGFVQRYAYLAAAFLAIGLAAWSTRAAEDGRSAPPLRALAVALFAMIGLVDTFADVRDERAASGEMRAVLEGHTDWVQCVAFHPSGSLLASASGHPGEERAVLLWNVADYTQRGEPLLGHEALITWVAFSPDGRMLASSSQDGTVRIWDPHDGKPLRVLQFNRQ